VPQVLSQVGYLCLGSIFLWVIIELIVQFGVRNAPNAIANQIPIGVTFGTFVNVRRVGVQGMVHTLCRTPLCSASPLVSLSLSFFLFSFCGVGGKK
jgi:hypothetical protein